MTATALAPTSTAGSSDAGAMDWKKLFAIGVGGGAVAIYVCLVGIVPAFAARPLIVGVVELGQAALLIVFSAIGYAASREHVGTSPARAIGSGAIAGGIAGVMLTLLIGFGSVVDLREMFLNASPVLYDLLNDGIVVSGAYVPILIGAITGGATGAVLGLPRSVRSPIVVGLSSLVFFGLFAGLLRTPMLVTPLANLARILFGPEGLTVIGAIVVIVGSIAASVTVRTTKPRQRVEALPRNQRRLILGPLAIVVLLLVFFFPLALGPFFAQVIALVALFVLLGLGLNITLGLAGLLDLGFVAFYAVGAYTVALLTSTAEYGLAGWTFWQAVPFGVVFAMLMALFLGLPILRIRGDYLAIATLGFGEIIRILAGSDLLKPILGGPRGILNIPKPFDVPPTDWLAGPVQIYYIALVCAAVVAFVAWRLRGSRLGRSWMAIREDEDVAEGMGVNLVQTKLLAYMLGGAFAGLAGAISVGLVGSIFASSIQLQLSINVAAIVIVGGMGSIPGVVLGALVLIGLPELFREFSDYRLLFYGLALMTIMIMRPEGLLPSRVARRELHTQDDVLAMPDDQLITDEERREAEAPLILLKATNVTKRFGGLTAVSELDFELEEGSIASVIGPNGAGKTTFFNCLTGFFHVDEGSITFTGHPIHTLRPDQVAHFGISRTYQNIRLFASMTAIENILVGQHNHMRSTWLGAIFRTKAQRREEEEAHAEARRLLEFVGLKDRGDYLAVKLPYGDQRRLEVARALANKPRLLLLDEPTAGMNPAESAQMTEFFRRLRGELGITVLLIEHEMRVVMDISEKITVLDYGRKIAEGTPKEIQRDPQVIEAYLGREGAAETAEVAEAGSGTDGPVRTGSDT